MKVKGYSEYKVVLERKRKNALKDYNRTGDVAKYEFQINNIEKALAELQQ